jgi:hypothetical protein
MTGDMTFCRNLEDSTGTSTPFRNVVLCNNRESLFYNHEEVMQTSV